LTDYAYAYVNVCTVAHAHEQFITADEDDVIMCTFYDYRLGVYRFLFNATDTWADACVRAITGGQSTLHFRCEYLLALVYVARAQLVHRRTWQACVRVVSVLDDRHV
jgi:hypothetical protein